MSLLCDWQLPAFRSWNGNTYGYKIQYRQTSTPSEWSEQAIFDYTAKSLVLYQFTLLKTYEIRIQSFNRYGHSPWSTTVVIFMEIGTAVVL